MLGTCRQESERESKGIMTGWISNVTTSVSESVETTRIENTATLLEYLAPLIAVFSLIIVSVLVLYLCSLCTCSACVSQHVLRWTHQEKEEALRSQTAVRSSESVVSIDSNKPELSIPVITVCSAPNLAGSGNGGGRNEFYTGQAMDQHSQSCDLSPKLNGKRQVIFYFTDESELGSSDGMTSKQINRSGQSVTRHPEKVTEAEEAVRIQRKHREGMKLPGIEVCDTDSQLVHKIMAPSTDGRDGETKYPTNRMTTSTLSIQ